MRTIALRALIISVSVGSLLGIIAILGGGMGTGGFKVLATSFTVAGASALVMASLAAWELPAARLWSRVGAWGSCTGGALLVFGLWNELEVETFWKLAAIVTVLGIAGAHGALISLARLAPRFHGVRVVALTNLVLLALAVCGGLWGNFDSDASFKLLSVLALLDVAFTITIGALDYVSRSNLIASEEVGEVCFCPRCGRRLWHPAGEIRCKHCKACFFIEMRPAQDLPTAIARE